MLGAFEFDGAPAERRRQAEVSHPHGGQRLRIAANGDVDAEPGVAQTQVLELHRNTGLKLVSRPGETPEAFAVRCDEAAQVAEDVEAAKIKQKLEVQQTKLEKAIALAQRRVVEVSTDQRTRQASALVAGAGSCPRRSPRRPA
jgi:hypothetical protein